MLPTFLYIKLLYQVDRTEGKVDLIYRTYRMHFYPVLVSFDVRFFTGTGESNIELVSRPTSHTAVVVYLPIQEH